ncbi:MAG TPA: hypothetical protein VMZ71_11685 [Gemmataceae bacterium]|nr:hypothetical protein [Gemmataceae bacterium]
MGLDRTIGFPPGSVPTWDIIRARLAQLGESPALRMIDGLPAFPDETPEPAWNELRVGLAAGMVTIRRAADSLQCVVWGNADDALRTAWDKLTWACAAGGVVETTSGSLSPDEFAAATGLQPT